MKKIKPGESGRKYGKRDNVFCIIYCTDARPYANYDTYKNSKKRKDRDKVDRVYPAVLAQMRHDCKIGFPGGKIELDDMSLIDGLKKELQEEINLVDINAKKLELLCTFSGNQSHSTTFSYKVSFDEMIRIIENSKMAPHSFIENMGSFFFVLDPTNLKNISKHNFCGTGLEELNTLVKTENLI